MASFGGTDPHRRAALAATALIAVVLLVLPLAAGWLGPAWVRTLAFAALYVMLALGLNIVVGFAGLLDLGYIAFYAVGAYTFALLASPHLTDNFPSIARTFPDGLHVPIWAAIPLGAAIAAAFGVLLGAPVLKLRGDYLAIVTLGFGEIIRIFLNNLNAPINLTNGPQGITLIDPVRVGPLRFDHGASVFGLALSSLQLYYYLFTALALLCILVCVRLQDSRLGRAWMAIREDEIAAKAMGINVRNVKLLAFGLGATFGGVSGSMFAAFQGFVSPESFSLMESVIVLSMIVLGGLGHIPGVILGAVMLSVFPELLRHTVGPMQTQLFGRILIDTEVLRMLLYGVALVLIMLYRPKGLWPAPQHGVAPRGVAQPPPMPPAAAA
ncbi:MAG TPA: ABC transporter ATP-binding protein [Burkholderiaceae bacterium]|nr:ABC transporter ATP-binding protein [Burkholderiaceae bacterium]